MDPSVDTEDWMHRIIGHCSARMGWHISKDAQWPLQYSDDVNALTVCLVCSKQHLRQLPKVCGAMHRSSQQVRDWQMIILAPLSDWVFWICLGLWGHCIWLNTSFPCHHANQAATIRRLEKLSVVYGFPRQIDSDWGSRCKGHDVKNWAKEHDIEWRSHLHYNLQAAGRFDRKEKWNLKAAD